MLAENPHLSQRLLWWDWSPCWKNQPALMHQPHSGRCLEAAKCFSVLVLSFTINRNVQRNHRLIYCHSHIGYHHGSCLVSICSHFLFQGLIKTVSIIFTFCPVRTGSSQCWKHNYKCISAKEKPLPAAEAVRTTIALAYWYKRYLHTST